MSLLPTIIAIGGPTLIERLREIAADLGRPREFDPTDLLMASVREHLPEEIRVRRPDGSERTRLVRAEVRMLKNSYTAELKMDLRDGWYVASGIRAGDEKHVVIPQELWSMDLLLDVDKAAAGLFRCECGLASCPKCLDSWRILFCQQTVEFLNGFDTVTLMTVVCTQPSLRQPDLAAIDPTAVLASFRTILARAGLGHIPMIGILEVDWNERSKCWEPHVHCFVAGEYPKTRKLRKWLRSRDPYKGKPPKGVYRPVQHDLLKTEQDVADAIAYATKLTIMRKRVTG